MQSGELKGAEEAARELNRAVTGPHNALLDLEELEEKDLDKIRANYLALAKSARDEVKRGRVAYGRSDQKG